MPTNQQFEDIFRDRFNALEETPPANGWEKIRQEITPKPKGFQANWLASGAMLAVFSAVVFYLLQHGVNLENQKMATTTLHTSEEKPSGNSKTVTSKTAVAVNSFAQDGAYEPAILNNEAAPENPQANLAAYKSAAKTEITDQETVGFAGKKLNKVTPTKTASAKIPAANSKKVKATKVIWVITVNPKAASVEKISTTAPLDSVEMPRSN